MPDSRSSQRSTSRFSTSLLALWCLVLLATLDASTSVVADDRPNIMIIMADDMGFSDIGPYGGEIHTPALDDLAKNGIRFTQFYNTGRCCPTRAALLTGLYPHQAGVGWMMADNGFDGYRGDLNRNCVTIAEALQPAGYSTYMSGKWHVTKDVRPDGDKSNWPRQRGFGRFFGTIHGAGSFYDPNSLTRDNTQIAPDKDFYYTDAISDNAIKFIDEHDTKKPFFLYVAYTAPHWPMHALPEDIERYKDRYNSGWDALRGERFSRQRKMGLISKDWPITPRDEGVPVWPQEKNKIWQERRMEVYAAMVDRMDFGIGRIIQKLKDEDQFENTLVLFLADNGGCAEEYGSRGPVRPSREQAAKLKPMKEGELQTRMQPRVTRDGRPVQTGQGVMPGPADTYIAYGKGWANASNTPFRLYKHWVHEGGIASPLIAHWPKKIDRKGEFERQPAHLIDLMATCVDLAKAEYPTQFGGEPIKPLEGKSLIPAFEGKKIKREALYWEHEGNRAIRVGKWKLVAKSATGPWELYDMEKDRTELNDLSAKMPEKVKELSEMWDAWAQRANVYPLTPYSHRSHAVSSKKSFELKVGDDLRRAKTPNIAKRGFVIQGQLTVDGEDGVLVAQGGTAHGFSLYVRDRVLHFATRRDGTLKIVKANSPLPTDEFKLLVELKKSGTVTAKVNGKEVMAGESGGTLVAVPQDGLQVGADKNGNVGDYESPFPLKMSGNLELELK